ncbi:unnamed protein product [Rhizophagus irregularis]|nr:unnamed protein product [Rhizophagus irregularis]
MNFFSQKTLDAAKRINRFLQKSRSLRGTPQIKLEISVTCADILVVHPPNVPQDLLKKPLHNLTNYTPDSKLVLKEAVLLITPDVPLHAPALTPVIPALITRRQVSIMPIGRPIVTSSSTQSRPTITPEEVAALRQQNSGIIHDCLLPG